MDVFPDRVSRPTAALARLAGGALSAAMITAAALAADAEKPADTDKTDSIGALKDLPKIRNEEEPSKPAAPPREEKPATPPQNDKTEKKATPTPSGRAEKTSGGESGKDAASEGKKEEIMARRQAKAADEDLPGAGEREAGGVNWIGLTARAEKKAAGDDEERLEEIRLSAVFENKTTLLMSNVSSEIFILGAPYGAKDVLFVARVFKDQFSINAGRTFAPPEKTGEFVRRSKAGPGDITYAGHIVALRDCGGRLLRTSSSSDKIALIAVRILSRAEGEFADEFGGRAEPPEGVKTPPRKQSP